MLDPACLAFPLVRAFAALCCDTAYSPLGYFGCWDGGGGPAAARASFHRCCAAPAALPEEAAFWAVGFGTAGQAGPPLVAAVQVQKLFSFSMLLLYLLL